MSNKTYDTLKFIALVVLPAIVVLITAVGTIWKLPYTEQIAGTVAAFATFLGALLKHSSDVYTREITINEANRQVDNDADLATEMIEPDEDDDIDEEAVMGFEAHTEAEDE